jgi:hypothetical protein
MRKSKKILNQLIEEIERTPVIQVACDKVGVSRNTFYRWMKEDQSFLERVSEAKSLGEGLVNDVAISNVLEGIKNKDSMYTKYWLNRKHPDFRKPYVKKTDIHDILSVYIEKRIKESHIHISEEIRDELKKGIKRLNNQWFVHGDNKK